MLARGSCSHRIFSSAGLNRICVVLKLREGFSDLSLNCFFFHLGNIQNNNFRETLTVVAYTEPDTKTKNSPRCWKKYCPDFSLLCSLWLKWRTFPNRVYVCVRVFVRDLAESLGAGGWTAWLWRERTMVWLYPSIQSLCRPSDSWAADPPSLPLLRTSSGNMAHTFCFQLHSEVLQQRYLFISTECSSARVLENFGST